MEHTDSNPVPQEKLRLAPSMSYAIGGQFGYVLTQMLVLAALARLRGPEAVGEFGLALALTTPFFMFAGMGGKSSQASDVTNRYSFSEYGGLMGATALLAVVASLAAGFFFAQGNTLLLVVIIALTKVFESISNLAYGAFQQLGRVDKVAASLLRRGAITVPFFIALLLLGFSTGIAFIAQLLVWSMLALFIDYPLASRMATGRLVLPSTSVRRVLALAKETAPLGASYFVNSLLVSLPRMFVERLVGLPAVGMLTVVTYFQQAGALLANSVSQMLVSRFARLRQASATQALRSSILIIFAFASVCSAAGILLVHFAGEWILRTVFGPEFASAQGLLMLITLAVCAKLFSMVPQSLLHAHRRFNLFFIREVAAVVLCVVLLGLLIPRLGLIGAGWAILAAAIFRLGLMGVAILTGGADTTNTKSPSRRLDAAEAS